MDRGLTVGRHGHPDRRDRVAPARAYNRGDPVRLGMVGHLATAREAIQRASDATDNETVRKQLRSIDEGLMEMTEAGDLPDDVPKTEGDVPHGDDLEEVEQRLADLAGTADGEARTHVKVARDAIDDYRQAVTRDW